MKTFIVLACLALASAAPRRTPTLAKERISIGGVVGPRIIGGQEATPHSYPWMVSLGLDFFGFGLHNCGGVLIGTEWVLTAAHCLDGVDTAYFGYHDSDTVDGQELYISEWISHPDFSNDGSLGFPNDIGLIKLEGSVELNSKIGLATLPADDSENFENLECVITGWGIDDLGLFPSDVLLEASIDVLTTEECLESWPNTPISRVHICVTDKETGLRGSCNGDSGGPLNCKVGDEWKVAGVTSWGVSGCDTAYASVYARTSYFREWIRENSGI